jgi:hypothetical protein
LYAETLEPKELLLIPGADHNNIPEMGGSPYIRALKTFVEQVNNRKQYQNEKR